MKYTQNSDFLASKARILFKKELGVLKLKFIYSDIYPLNSRYKNTKKTIKITQRMPCRPPSYFAFGLK